MASSPITSCQIYGETREIVRYFIFLGSKITEDSDCCHDIKRCLLLGRKAMTYLDSILKNRDITLLTKVHLVKAMFFPVVTYAVRVGRQRKLSTEELVLVTVVMERTLESSLNCKKRSNQSILKKINLEYSLEGLMLKLQYCGHLIARADSLEKTLLLLLLLSRFSRVRLCAISQTAAHQAPPSLGFSRQDTGVGCHFLLQDAGKNWRQEEKGTTEDKMAEGRH